MANTYARARVPRKEEKGCFHFAANDSIEGFDFRQVVFVGRGGRIRSGEPIDFRA